jgi:hypothetical protein
VVVLTTKMVVGVTDAMVLSPCILQQLMKDRILCRGGERVMVSSFTEADNILWFHQWIQETEERRSIDGVHRRRKGFSFLGRRLGLGLRVRGRGFVAEAFVTSRSRAPVRSLISRWGREEERF